MFVDFFKALGTFAILAAAWWFWTAFIGPVWDALYPMAVSTDFGQANAGTLSFLKMIWQNLPLILGGAIIVWVYLRAQRREPDQYYVPPGGYG